ncbi:hypothetical protein C8A00DRAFT_41494 [Chaetomidium leptoderma]|uniref:Nucleoside phosphorylase domain-containing protein n=1 Tax=Chaetomidium leptoderma TaxID=669021 RepID=A0AAN6VTF5_9PEZI|nr:hypothetical protein C8A00DRAFT_41494 [Chaetomidium leptoderma]
MTSTPGRNPTHNDYTVGWVSTLPLELAAATAMLEERHVSLSTPPSDTNTYTLGSIGGHNIAIACLPMGKTGNNPAATVATQMIRTFPFIRFGLMVGIGAGIPPKVRLGDVVVSTPTDKYPGVVQWDFGKAEDGGKFERKGALDNPPTTLLTALTHLKTEHALNGSRIPDYLAEAEKKYPIFAATLPRPGSLQDVLFKASYSHIVKSATGDEEEEEEEEASCPSCDKAMTVDRKPRAMTVHYGLIASETKLKKALENQPLCLDIGAAGLMDSFPCIVVRGICDYADSHKNKVWQNNAAAVAAAFAKELLNHVQPRDVKEERTVKDILHQVGIDIQKASGYVEAVKAHLDKKEDLEILEWLTKVNYGQQQSDYLNQRQPGTGQWLLNSDEFKTWVEGDRQTLFCPGIPGSGKTILTSIVIDKLTTGFNDNDNIVIAYLYCNFRRKDEQKAENLIASVLKQLAQSRPSLPESVKSLHDKHKNKRTEPSFGEISQALQSVASVYSRVFVVVDALDECQASDGRHSRVLSEIFALQANKCGANIFATSRFIPEITTEFARSVQLEIRASDEDVKGYIEGHINRDMPRLRTHIDECPKLMEEIRIGISSAVQGMFLLAQIYLSSLNDKTTPKKVRDALAGFQEQAMERIRGQEQGLWDLAKRALTWITCATRPLTTMELRHALAVEENAAELDKCNLPQIELIVSVCAGLVTVDEASDIIRLSDITKICVTYLSFNVFESGMCQSNHEFKERLQSNPLYDYAARNWGHHARKSSRLPEVVEGFLMCQATVEAASQAFHTTNGHSQLVPKQTTGLHLAASLGVHEATPLSWAARGGHEAVVELLLATDQAEVDSKDRHGQTPLSRAAKGGHEAVVKLLLATGQAEINSKDRYGQTPLSRAADCGHESVVRLLLETGQAEVDSKDILGRTPLSLAAGKGHEAVAKLLRELDE